MCYANAKTNLTHPSISQLYRIVDRLTELGIKDITLVGGDPALYTDIVQLASYMKKKGIKLSVLSNTLDFIPQKDSVLEYIDIYEGTIHHSLEEKHDIFCGCSGAYEKLVGNLKFFSLQNKSVGLAINMIPFNYNVIYDLIKNVILKNITIDHIIMQRIIQFGRAHGSYQYELNTEMLEIIMQQIERAEKEFNLNIIFEDPIPLCSIPQKYWRYMHPCEWGITKLSVDYNGNLARCGADVFHSFGSIFDDDIIDKWNTNHDLDDFREKRYLPPKCQNCKNIDKCGGGCPISREPENGFNLDYLAK